MIFFGHEKAPEILGNARPGYNGGGSGSSFSSLADISVVKAPRVKMCPVCGENPLPRGKAACSVRCRKRKERILRKAREEALLYLDKD